ncbi:MAG: YfcC family protein, partial [Gemmatimonadales bacterium]|nr:YfcC family protein [Gemmatimonadales bacterium]
MTDTKDTRQVRALDTSLIVFGMIILAAVLTWIVPAGAFDKQVIDVPGAGLRDVVVPGSYAPLREANPQGVGAVLRAPIRGLIEAADIVAFVLLVGGAFAVLQATGAIDAGLHRLVGAA